MIDTFRVFAKKTFRIHVFYLLILTILIVYHQDSFLSKNIKSNQKEKKISSTNRSRLVGRSISSDRFRSEVGRRSVLSKNTDEKKIENDLTEDTERSLRFASYLFQEQKKHIIQEYKDKYDQVGLSAVDQQVALTQVEAIEEKRLQIQLLQDELEFQKADYDHHIQSSLSEDEYTAYRGIESESFYETYLDDFNNHLSQSQRPELSLEEQKELKGLLSRINGGVTVDRSKGPYGSPSSIHLSVFESDTQSHFIEDKISLLMGERDFLTETASSENLRKSVEIRYSAQIQQYLNLAKIPPQINK